MMQSVFQHLNGVSASLVLQIDHNSSSKHPLAGMIRRICTASGRPPVTRLPVSALSHQTRMTASQKPCR